MSDDQMIAEPEITRRLSKELRQIAGTMQDAQARCLVDLYYLVQDNRIRAGNQIFALDRTEEPHGLADVFHGQMDAIENQIRAALGVYAKSQEIGRWALSVKGIGPVLAAGLMAHIDVRRAATAGQVWRFAGLDPTRKWIGAEGAAKLIAEVCPGRAPVTMEQVAELATRTAWKTEGLTDAAYGIEDLKRAKVAAKKESPEEPVPVDRGGVPSRALLQAALAKCPWNQALKCLCWKIGESFVKVSGHADAFYGQVWAERKALEAARNAAGGYAEQAAESLARLKAKGSVTMKANEAGLLSDGHVHARAKRYAVKLFLAHYLEQGRKYLGLPVVAPYPVAILGHAHVIPPPVEVAAG